MKPSPTDPHDDPATFFALRLLVSGACAVVIWGGILILSL